MIYLVYYKKTPNDLMSKLVSFNANYRKDGIKKHDGYGTPRMTITLTEDINLKKREQGFEEYLNKLIDQKHIVNFKKIS